MRDRSNFYRTESPLKTPKIRKPFSPESVDNRKPIFKDDIDVCLRLVQEGISPRFRPPKLGDNNECISKDRGVVNAQSSEVRFHPKTSSNHAISDRIWQRTWLDQIEPTIFHEKSLPESPRPIFYEHLLEKHRRLEKKIDERILARLEARNFPPINAAMEREVRDDINLNRN